jgi:adenylylsulfate kinase-like enzyme
MILWIYAQSGQGKSTLAKSLLQPNTIWLDSDAIRSGMNKDLGFSTEDRIENNLRVARLAKLLSDQGHSVIVSMITPFKSLRVQIQKICNPVFICLGGQSTKDRPFEPPETGLEFNIKI